MEEVFLKEKRKKKEETKGARVQAYSVSSKRLTIMEYSKRKEKQKKKEIQKKIVHCMVDLSAKMS